MVGDIRLVDLISTSKHPVGKSKWEAIARGKKTHPKAEHGHVMARVELDCRLQREFLRHFAVFRSPLINSMIENVEGNKEAQECVATVITVFI